MNYMDYLLIFHHCRRFLRTKPLLTMLIIPVTEGKHLTANVQVFFGK